VKKKEKKKKDVRPEPFVPALCCRGKEKKKRSFHPCKLASLKKKKKKEKGVDHQLPLPGFCM